MLLSEMFGVNETTPFSVRGRVGHYKVNNNTLMRSFCCDDNWEVVSADTVLGILLYEVPSNIIHLPPPLTDEQMEQLRAIWTLGYRHLAKDKCGSVYAYEIKPYIRVCDTWLLESGDLHFCCTKPTKCLESLVSWSDPEPFDIGKALGVGE